MDVFKALASMVELGLTIYGWMLVAVILLTWVQPDPRNPIINFLNRLTTPYFRWVARMLPAKMRFFGVYVALLLVWWAEIFIPATLLTLGLLFTGTIGPAIAGMRLGGHFILASAITIKGAANFFVLLLVVWFVLTLVHPQVHNPIVRAVYVLVDFLITPIQRVLPRMRVDVSPLVAAALIWLVSAFALTPIAHFGYGIGASYQVRSTWFKSNRSFLPQQLSPQHPPSQPTQRSQPEIY